MKKLKDISKKQWGLISTSIGSILIFIGLLAMVGIGSGDTYAATTCSCTSYGKDYELSGTTCTKTTTTKGVTCCSSGNCSGYSACTSNYTGCSTYNEGDKVLKKGCTLTETITKDAVCTTTPETVTVAASFNGNTKSCTIPSGSKSCIVTAPVLPNGSTGWGSSGCTSGYAAGTKISISSNVTYYPCYEKKTVAANFNGNTKSCTIPSGSTSCTVTTPDIPNGATGWGTTSSCIGGAPAGISISISSNVTYYPCKASSSSSSCYTAAFQVDGGVVNTITGKLNADDGGCEVTAPSYTCSSGSFKGWFTNPTVCNQDVSGTGAGNILTLNSNKTYYGCCYKKSDDSGKPGGDSGKPGGDSGKPGGDSGNSGGGSGEKYSVILQYYYHEQNTTWKYFDRREEFVTKGASFTPYNITPPEGYYANNVYQLYDCTNGGDGAPYLGTGKVGVDSFIVNTTMCVNVQFIPINGQGAAGGNSNVNNNPSTATKAPLVIALIGVMSLAFGVFTYWKNRKVTDM